jgi:tetratricopeptide (TPR) repeat protein
MSNDNDRLNLLLDLRRYADAEKLARDVIAKNPDWASGYTHLARALINQNKKDEAIAAAREGVRKAPQDSWAVGTLACALNWFGNSRAALEPAEQAVRLDPRYPWAYAMLANILFNLARYGEALEKAREGLKYDPMHESLYRWKGWAEHKLGKHDAALATADEALKHHPNSHLIANLIGCVRWDLAEKSFGRERIRLHREADVKIRDAVRLDPTQPAYRDNLRGNAVSCRRYILMNAAPLVCFAAMLPLALVVLLVVHPKNDDWAIVTGVVALLTFLLAAMAAPNSAVVHIMPLERWEIPPTHATPRERETGRAEFGALVFILSIPYFILFELLLG